MAKRPISPTMSDSQVRATALGNPWMIEKKIISDMPLPTPRSVICSPSHITNTPPTVRTTTVVKAKVGPGEGTALPSPCRKLA